MTSKATPKAAPPVTPAGLGRGKTSGIWQTIYADFPAFERRRLAARSDWRVIAAQLAAEGVVDGAGRPASAAIVKRTFFRVRLATRQDRKALAALDAATVEAEAAETRRTLAARTEIAGLEARAGLVGLVAKAATGTEAERLAVLAAVPHLAALLGLSAPVLPPVLSLAAPSPMTPATPKAAPQVAPHAAPEAASIVPPCATPEATPAARPVVEGEDAETPEETAGREARAAERAARQREWQARKDAEAAAKAAALDADEAARMEQEEEARATFRRLVAAGIPHEYEGKAPIVAALVRAQALAAGRPAPAWTVDPAVRATYLDSPEQRDAHDDVERMRVYAIVRAKGSAETEAMNAKRAAEIAALDAQIAAKLRADSSPAEIEEAARLTMERDAKRDGTTRFEWNPSPMSSNRERDLKARAWAIRKAQRRQAALIAEAAARPVEAPAPVVEAPAANADRPRISAEIRAAHRAKEDEEYERDLRLPEETKARRVAAEKAAAPVKAKAPPPPPVPKPRFAEDDRSLEAESWRRVQAEAAQEQDRQMRILVGPDWKSEAEAKA